MKNYANDLTTLPKYGARVIIGGTAFHFYKTISTVHFYSDKDYIVFQKHNDKHVYIVVGKVGVSSDEEVYANYQKAKDLLLYKNAEQQELPLFNENDRILW